MRMAATPDNAARPGWVYLVGAGPGDPELITVRGAALLESADVVLHDELIDHASLLCARDDAEVRSVGKRGHDRQGRSAKQLAINSEIVTLARAGKSVVRLKGGDPFLFGRGAEEALALRDAGVPYEVVPGISSPLGATAYAGIPLTDRDAASSVIMVTAVTRDGADFDFTELAATRGTICVFMARHRLERVTRRLMIDAGRAPETPAAILEWVSHPRQRVVEGTLGDIADRASDAAIGTPSLVIVGDVAKLRDKLAWFDRQPLFGKRVLVTRPAHQIAPTAALLRRRGAEPIAFPTIFIEASPAPERVAQAIDELASYDLVTFTSDNGVQHFWRALRAHGRDARAFGQAKLAAIGPATAAGLARHGLVADIVAETFVAEPLAEAIIEVLEPGQRVLIPRAEVAREILPEMLRAAGLEVDVVAIYRTVTGSRERAAELIALLSSVDVVTLTSSSTATKLCELLGDDAASVLAGKLLASIGPITTATAIAHGLEVAVTASVSTSSGLIDALEAHLVDEANSAG
jgi:uroporphyrinogen III methyltransferase / synthase